VSSYFALDSSGAQFITAALADRKTIRNTAGGAFYYSADPTVSSLNCEGTVTSGQSVTITSPKYITSQNVTEILVEDVDEAADQVDRDALFTSLMPGLTSDARYDAALAEATARGGARIVFDQREQFTAAFTGRDIPNYVTLDAQGGGYADCSACTTVDTEFFRHKGTEGTHYVLAVDLAAGSRTATVSAANAASINTALTGNNWVFVASEQQFDPLKTHQPRGEYIQVASVNQTTGVITFKTVIMDETGYLSGDVSGKRAYMAAVTMAQGLQVTQSFKAAGPPNVSGVGFAIDRAERAVIRGEVSGFGDKCVYFYGSVGCSVDGANLHNALSHKRGYGVMFAYGSQDCELVNSTLWRCRHCVTFGGGSTRAGVPRRIHINDNFMYGTRSTGDVLDTHAGCEHIEARGNFIYDSARNGINIECPKFTAVGNHIFRPARHGISWIPYSDEYAEVVIKDNDIHSPAIAGVRATTSKKNIGQGANIRWLQITDNKVYDASSYAIQVDRYDGAFRWKNIEVRNNEAYHPKAPFSFFLLGFDDSNCFGNRVHDAPGNHIAFKVNDCQRVRNMRDNFAFLTDQLDSTTVTLGADYNPTDANITVSATAGLSSRGSLTIDSIDYYYAAIVDGTHLGPIRRQAVAALEEDLSSGDTVANMDAAPATAASIVIDSEVMVVASSTQNADGETWDVTLTRTAPVAHDQDAIVYYGQVHSSGATVSFSYGAGMLFLACSDFDARGSGSTGYYGTRADNDCTYYILDERPSRNVTVQAARLGSGTGGIKNAAPHAANHAPSGTDALNWTNINMVGLFSALPAAASTNDGLTYYATDVGGGVLFRSNGSAWVAVSSGDSYRGWRSSDVSTMARADANSQTATSGLVYAARVTCRAAGTYTKIRFATGSTGSAVTQMRAGVWDTSSVRLKETADLSGSFAQNTLYDNVALDASITLAFGDEVFLGVTIVGTSPSISGKAVPASAITALTPVVGRSASGYASGDLPDLTTNTARLPWVELVP
jgi:hypothetical protein